MPKIVARETGVIVRRNTFPLCMDLATAAAAKRHHVSQMIVHGVPIDLLIAVLAPLLSTSWKSILKYELCVQ
jgi:hypothetical protein